jgi:hypothetical protein
VDSTTIYGGLYAIVDGGSVGFYNHDGGVQANVATADFPNQIALDSKYLYVVTQPDTIAAVPVDAGKPVAFVSPQSYPLGIVVDTTTVFWVNYGDMTIRSAPKF